MSFWFKYKLQISSPCKKSLIPTKRRIIMSLELDTTISKIYSKKYSDFLVRNLGGLLLKPNQWRQQLEKARFNFSLRTLAEKDRYTPTCITLLGKEIKLV